MKFTKQLIVLFAVAFLTACGSGSEAQKADEYTEAMAKEHKDDKPVSNPASEAKPEAEVVSEMVKYATVDGTEYMGHLSMPKGATGDEPALIVIHEWWGLNDNIKSMADQLAGQGYVALAVDLYGGKAATKPDDAMAMMKGAMANPAPLQENLKQAQAFLAGKGATKVGVIGWCFGGMWSLQSGLLMPDKIDAMVIYYGRLETDATKLSTLNMPILGIFGGKDKGIPVESVKAFETALKEGGKNASIHIYDEADHAFANPSGQHYDETAAKDAWAKTTKFLAENLKN